MKPTTARVAYVTPTFTLTPYANFKHSFYAFYLKYKISRSVIDTDLDWLRTRVTGNWSTQNINDEKPLYDFLLSNTASRCGLVAGRNLIIVNDVSVDNGSLFVKGTRQYDVLILGHQEYVTRNEYNQLKHFVASGGRVVAMSGNLFWAEVNYTKTTGVETFVVGHGFQFNGKVAWHSDHRPFDKESIGWFGSAFAPGMPQLRGAILNDSSRIGHAIRALYHSDLAFTGYAYPHNEVNHLGNLTHTQIIATFYRGFVYVPLPHFQMPPSTIQAYQHGYVNGEVICLCVFGENVIMRDLVAQFFLIYATTSGFHVAVASSCDTCYHFAP